MRIDIITVLPEMLEGLKAGKSWASMTSVVFFEMLRAVLAAGYTSGAADPTPESS